MAPVLPKTSLARVSTSWRQSSRKMEPAGPRMIRSSGYSWAVFSLMAKRMGFRRAGRSSRPVSAFCWSVISGISASTIFLLIRKPEVEVGASRCSLPSVRTDCSDSKTQQR